VAILDFLAQRHSEIEPQAPDEVLLLIAVIDDRVHEPTDS
jgi:hypothetical protein